MKFIDLAEKRYSSRKYDAEREVEEEKIDYILSTARLAPSACNAQPYHITVCRGDAAHKVASATQGMGMNKFTSDAPVIMTIECRKGCYAFSRLIHQPSKKPKTAFCIYIIATEIDKFHC